MDKDLMIGILKKANENAKPYGVKWHLLANSDKHTVFCVMDEDVTMGRETHLRQIKEIIVVDHMDSLVNVLKKMENLSRECYNNLRV